MRSANELATGYSLGFLAFENAPHALIGIRSAYASTCRTASVSFSKSFSEIVKAGVR
jgi:hypothetical protein